MNKKFATLGITEMNVQANSIMLGLEIMTDDVEMQRKIVDILMRQDENHGATLHEFVDAYLSRRLNEQSGQREIGDF